MTAHYELWHVDDGDEMFDVPRPSRCPTLHEPGARLLLRFDAETWDEAKEIRERFLFEDNPDHLVPLDIPASEFCFSQYRCGVCAGDRVRLKMDYHSAAHGEYFGYFDLGTSFNILAGDIEAPQNVWMRVHYSPLGRAPVGQFHHVRNDEHFFTYFERVPESTA